VQVIEVNESVTSVKKIKHIHASTEMGDCVWVGWEGKGRYGSLY